MSQKYQFSSVLRYAERINAFPTTLNRIKNNSRNKKFLHPWGNKDLQKVKRNDKIEEKRVKVG